MKINKQKKISNKKIFIIIVTLCIVVLVGFLLVRILVDDTNSEKNNTPKPSSSSASDTPNQGAIDNNRANNSTEAPSITAPPNVRPSMPIGVFVSNHEPNLSGAPAPNIMSSTCSTTPGSDCRIEFKNGSTIKSLPPQRVDASGNTFWDWTLQDIGLTAGTWKITVVATNGSQESTATDIIDLIVRN